MPAEPPRTYLLSRAAEILGYSRTNTVRELYLATEAQRRELGHRYDGRGRVILDAQAVEALAERLEREHQERGNWRVRNLGRHALKGGRSAPAQKAARSQDVRRRDDPEQAP